MNKHLVFVYGTLRRGGRNNYMLADADFLCRHWTRPQFTMFQLGTFPAVVPRGSTAIAGEIYRVSDRLFGLLDELECYPQVFFRERIETPAGDSWMYIYNRLVGTEHEVEHGDWMRHLEQSKA